jgi:trehalose 6-phosphate synthase/phosphatase
MAERLLIASNRLPLTIHAAETGVRLAAADGGLATGLGSWHARSDGLWFGWPGDMSQLNAAQRADVDGVLRAQRVVPVHLSRDEIDRYYHGFSNRILWPLFHYLIDRMPVDPAGWDAYVGVNQRFADAMAAEYRSGDRIWLHDYQLMLLPAMLRERLPQARIGFFLHIPFPSSEVFRILPWRREILTGLLGADLVGFHAFAYLRHFVASLLHVDGIEADIDRVRTDDRDVKLGVFPMGIDAAALAERARDPEVLARVEAIRREAGGRRIVLGVDRLDYTKGIPRRLQAMERLFQRCPELRDEVRFIQVAVPSRGEVDSYRRFRREVEERVGRLNGSCGTLSSAPVHYVHRPVSNTDLVALYRAADVMLVTPLRDGMNLVAKEYVASRVDGDGVLVLSEFAGAAAELGDALVVNPYDIDGVARSIRRALSMPERERRTRMEALRQRVCDHDIHGWSRRFIAALNAVRRARSAIAVRPEDGLAGVLGGRPRSARLRLLLDYDGTLVPFAASPELARPDEALIRLLTRLAAAPRVNLDIVSGRTQQTLEAWLGDLPVALWAEHGFWHRPSRESPWSAHSKVGLEWIARIRPIFDQFSAATPGSSVEVKGASLAWHYRRADPSFGARQAHELRMLLGDALSNQPVEVLEGNMVIEARLRGVSKATVAQHLQSEGDVTAIGIGDDRTDDELFRALPPSCIAIAVGSRPSGARFRLNDWQEVRRFLETILADPTAFAAGGSVRSSAT